MLKAVSSPACQNLLQIQLFIYQDFAAVAAPRNENLRLMYYDILMSLILNNYEKYKECDRGRQQLNQDPAVLSSTAEPQNYRAVSKCIRHSIVISHTHS